MPDLVAIAKEWGLPFALVCIYIYRDWAREKAFLQLQKEFNDFLESRLADEQLRTEQITKVVTQSTHIMSTINTTMLEFCKSLLKRPCLVEEKK